MQHAETLVVEREITLPLQQASFVTELQRQLDVSPLPETAPQIPLVSTSTEHAALVRASATQDTACWATRAGLAIVDVTRATRMQTCHLNVTTLVPFPSRASAIHSIVRSVLENALATQGYQLQAPSLNVRSVTTEDDLPLEAIGAAIRETNTYDVTWHQPNQEPFQGELDTIPPMTAGLTPHPVHGRSDPTKIVLRTSAPPVVLSGVYRPRARRVECQTVTIHDCSSIDGAKNALAAVPQLDIGWPTETATTSPS